LPGQVANVESLGGDVKVKLALASPRMEIRLQKALKPARLENSATCWKPNCPLKPRVVMIQ